MLLRNKKTGEIFDCKEILILREDSDGIWQAGQGNSLAELNKEWEDYAPKEPLIKDEKIRKAVRAWAYVNSIENAIYAERPNKTLCTLMDMDTDDFAIEFVGWIPTLKDGEVYTIAELCGEEDE